MLSILIPTYNYSIKNLVTTLHQQLCNEKIKFEIICLDDDSQQFVKENLKINELSFTTYEISSVNRGISKTRQSLVRASKYDWIILLDADTELKFDYIKNYLKVINLDYNFVFGGFDYKGEKPDNDKMLRWKYGKENEAISAINRNKKPYKVTIAANLLANRSAYLNLGLDQFNKKYAMDYFLGSKLKSSNSKVLHIDNSVYHLGIETSKIYLDKKRLAVKTLLELYNEKKVTNHSNNLLSLFINIKKVKANYIFAFLFKICKSSVSKQLVGANPNIFLLQFYKISYMCHLDLRKT